MERQPPAKSRPKEGWSGDGDRRPGELPDGAPRAAPLAGPRHEPARGLADMLASADSARRVQLVRSLQAQHGNAFVQRVLARESARATAGATPPAVPLRRPVVRRHGGSPAAVQRNEEDDETERLNQLTVDGVLAFEALGSFSPTTDIPLSTLPEVPGEAPAGLRPALGHLQRAKQYRFYLAMPSAEEAVLKELGKEGPIVGLGKWLLHGELLVLQERLRRAQTAKVEWQQARPTLSALVGRYSGMNGANPTYAATLKGLVARLDTEMTERVASLRLELEAAVSPEYAEIVTAVTEAKQASGVMEQMIERAEALERAGDTVKTAHEALGGAREAHEKLEAFISLYESPAKIVGALAKMNDTKTGPEGLAVAMAGTFDIAESLADLVKDTGALVVRGVADAYTGYASYLAAAADSNDITTLARAADVTKRANDLREFAGRLEKLGKLADALGALSGALGFMQGLAENDFEETMSGAIDVGEGVAGLALEGGAAAGASVGFLQLRAMVYVVAEMSRARQAIENAAIGEVVKDLEEELNAAALHARKFDVAISEGVWRQNATDAVEKELGEQYLEKAAAQVKPLQARLVRALSSATQGSLSKYGVLADTFTAAFGGHSLAVATRLDLEEDPDIGSPQQLMARVTYLDEVLGHVAEAVGDLGITLAALGREAGGKVKWTQQRHNTLRVETEVTFAEGANTIRYRPGQMELEGPIDDEGYREWLSQKVRGKALGDVTSLIHLEIEADVLGEAITMAGSNGRLARHSAIPPEVEEAIAGRMVGPGGEAAVDEKTSARALWRFHLRNVEVPPGHTFD